MRTVRYFLVGLLVAAAMAVSVALVVRNLPDRTAPAPTETARPADRVEPAAPVAVAPTPPVAPAPPPAAPRQVGPQGRATDPLAIPPAGTIEPVPQQQASVPAPSRLTLTNEQEERLRYVLLSHNIMQSEASDFPLQLDGAVPEHVPLTPLPIEVADIVPNYRAYSYVISQNRIAIVITDRRKIGLLISL